MGGLRERMFLLLGQLLKAPELAEGVEVDARIALFAAEGCNEVLSNLIGTAADCLHRHAMSGLNAGSVALALIE